MLWRYIVPLKTSEISHQRLVGCSEQDPDFKYRDSPGRYAPVMFILGMFILVVQCRTMSGTRTCLIRFGRRLEARCIVTSGPALCVRGDQTAIRSFATI
jgi:hypothetical protein